MLNGVIVLNHVCLTGRPTADPIVIDTANGAKVVKYTLAVQRRKTSDGQNAADFISCTAFGRIGDFAEKYVKKGMRIGIEGRIQTGSYDKDGVRHYTVEVIVSNHEFLENKKPLAESVLPSEDLAVAAPVPPVELDDGSDKELPF